MRDYVHILGVTATSTFRIAEAEKSDDGFLTARSDSYRTQWPRLLLIYDWTEEHVMQYIRKNSLRLNPCYSRFGHSGNCMLCPKLYGSKRKLVEYLSRLEKADPRWYKIVTEFLRAYVQKHRDTKIVHEWYTGLKLLQNENILNVLASG